MAMQKLRGYLALVGLVVILGACGGEDAPASGTATVEPTTPPPTNTTPDAPPVIDPAQRPTLEAHYEELQAAQQAIAAVWQDLQAGATVACDSELPPLRVPQAYRGEGALSGQLFEAATHLQEAYGLWEAECQNPRPQPPSDIIDRGLRAALTAGDYLREVEAALTAP